MTCDCCENSRAGPEYPMHDPSCIYCGARLIWKIQRKPIGREEAMARCRKVLQDWLHYGHSEAELRKLAKLEALPVAPESSTGRGKLGR